MQVIEKTNKFTDMDDEAIKKDLARRFDEPTAQWVMEQIKRADQISKGSEVTPDCFGTKAVSEAAELYHSEAKAVLKRLNASKRDENTHQNVTEFDSAFLKKELKKLIRFYLRFHRAYDILYRQAVHTYTVKAAYVPQYKEVHVKEVKNNQTTICLAA